MTKQNSESWPIELVLIPLAFTLSGISFTIMILIPTLPPPYYYTINAFFGFAGTSLCALGTWLTARLHVYIQALKHHEEPNYQSLTVLLILLIVIVMMALSAFTASFFIIGSPTPPSPPP